MTRLYHSVNTRYNIHYNADVAYKEALEAKSKAEQERDNLSQLLYIFPQNLDSASMLSAGGFNTTIDKTTKAIKLHSIKTRPQRDPNKRNDTEYQAWLQQKEFTPFMDNVWMLLAKAEFQEGNYLKSITTFLYITKIYSSRPEIVTECQLWVARAYSEMGWMYEAGNVIHKIELAGGAPEQLKGLYSLVKANYMVYNNEYTDAIPHLEYAIKKEKDSSQKLRMKYLLGQLYANLGDKLKADKAFASVKGMNTPYKYTFNAQLQQIHLDTSPSKIKSISSLHKMAGGSKNKDYQDQIYYTIGNIYLNNQDTIKAIDNYKKAITKSTRNGYDKAICQIKLGDIYFTQRNFVLAQPCYSEALGQLSKLNTDYSRVSLRSEVLDELVVHVKTVYEQDSLQHLAQLPEAERLEIINKRIEDLKKQEKDQQKEEDLKKRIEEQASNISSWDDISETLFENNTPAPTQPSTSFGQQGNGAFYFYNAQAVNQGKIAFQKQWGNRKLEDDWRRKNKISAISDFENPDMTASTDSLANSQNNVLAQDGKNDDESKNAVEDLYSVDYYMQQLPLTPEAIEESNILIENALFNMGKIYKDKLEDMPLAIDAFSTDIKRFPQTPNLEEIYYQLLLIYMRLGDDNMMSVYRSKLINEYPVGKYANPLSEPDYVWNFKHMASLQDSLYNAAYTAYKRADVETVRANYRAMKTKYPFTDLMPNFALLNALSYAQTRDAKGLNENLEALTKDYPKAEITPLATEILTRIKDGKVLLSDGSPITDFDWSKAYEGDSIKTGDKAKALQYSDTLDVPYMLLLMFKPKTIDRNELLYQVADYNFSNYVIQTFDLNFDTDPPYEILQMKGFSSFAAVRSYLNKALSKEGLVQHIDSSILVLPISVENYSYALPRLGLEQYMSFFAKNFKEQLPSLISLWNNKKIVIEEKTVTKVEEKTSTVEPEIINEVKRKPERKPVDLDPIKEVNDKEITADDLLTKNQLDKVGKVNDIVTDIENVLSNPVDGIKNLFEKYNNREKLTKEEKAARKEEEKLRKQEEKELKAKLKGERDSINKIEKFKTDSIAKAEKAIEDSIKMAKQDEERNKREEIEQKKNTTKIASQEREKIRKQKEEERKEKERIQKERIRQREQDRKNKEKARETERKEKEKQTELKRKQSTKQERN